MSNEKKIPSEVKRVIDDWYGRFAYEIIHCWVMDDTYMIVTDGNCYLRVFRIGDKWHLSNDSGTKVVTL